MRENHSKSDEVKQQEAIIALGQKLVLGGCIHMSTQQGGRLVFMMR